MKIRDPKLRQTVDVSDQDCPKRSCYWPRPDPGVFTQGQGYRSRPGPQQWLCGEREARGCPTQGVCETPGCRTAYKPLQKKCLRCHASLPE